jgi:hypothetical protein
MDHYLRKPSLYPAELRDRSPADSRGRLEAPYQSGRVIASLRNRCRGYIAAIAASPEYLQPHSLDAWSSYSAVDIDFYIDFWRTRSLPPPPRNGCRSQSNKGINSQLCRDIWPEHIPGSNASLSHVTQSTDPRRRTAGTTWLTSQPY